MSFLLLFQNLLHELENRSLFHQKKSVHFWSSHLNTEKFPSYPFPFLFHFHSLSRSAAVAEFLQGLHPQSNHSSPRGKGETPALSPGGCWGPCKSRQAVPAGCPCAHCVPARAALCLCSSLSPRPCWLRQGLSASLPGSLVQGTLHCQNCSLISGRLI